MDFNNPNAILEFLLYSNVPYSEYVKFCDSLSTRIQTLHRTSGGLYFNNVVQCFLECYKIKNNFSKSVWLPNKYAKKQDVKPNAYPVFFKRWCANNTYTSPTIISEVNTPLLPEIPKPTIIGVINAKELPKYTGLFPLVQII